MKELLAKLKIVGLILEALWTVGVLIFVISTPITNPNLLEVVVMMFLVWVIPIAVLNLIWWLLPKKWKPEKVEK